MPDDEKTKLWHAGAAHRFERVVRGDGALLEVEPRALEAPARLGVRGEVEDHVVPRIASVSRVEIERVGLDERRAPGREVRRR